MGMTFKIVKMLFYPGEAEVELDLRRIGQRACCMVDDKVGEQDWEGQYVVRILEQRDKKRYGIVVCFEGSLERDSRWHLLMFKELEGICSTLMGGLRLRSVSSDDIEVEDAVEGESITQETMKALECQGFDIVWSRSVERMSRKGECTLVAAEWKEWVRSEYQRAETQVKTFLLEWAQKAYDLNRPDDPNVSLQPGQARQKDQKIVRILDAVQIDDSDGMDTGSDGGGSDDRDGMDID